MKCYYLLIAFILLTTSATAQVCTGNLGDNIFTDGDFGSGAANVVSTDPRIAPGYTYDNNVPPDDGDYVLTNNTGAWSGLYGTWLAIPDNSSDPNGYMMVVNASFSPGLFYEKNVTNLCENTLYEFSADIINMVKRGVGGHGFPNVSFLLDGVELFNTGDIQQDEIWHNFGFTFTTAPGQTSVILSLQNNAPGGTGNDLALDNISFRACGPSITINSSGVDSICADGTPVPLVADVVGNQYTQPTFQWQESFDGGNTWVDIVGATQDNYTATNLTSSVHYFRYLLANGSVNIQNSLCRVNSDPKLIFVIPIATTLDEEICEGDIYPFGGTNYSVSGTYMATFKNTLNCDSTVILNLSVFGTSGSVSDSICEGDIYPFGGLNYDQTGTYTATFKNILNCDSVVTLDLSVFPTSGSVSDSICEGEVYPLGGMNYNETGTYTASFKNVLNCDSIVTVNLTVFPAHDTINVSICDGLSYAFGGDAYTQAGRYYDTLTNVLNCDSVVTLDLTVIPSTMMVPNVSVIQRDCESDPAASITVNFIDNGVAPYTISLNSAPINIGDANANLRAGNYQLFIEDDAGCVYEEEITITPTLAISLELGDDIDIQLGQEVQLNPVTDFTVDSFQWSPSFLCDSGCSAPIWYPTDTMQVVLNAVSEFGCIASDSLTINVEKVRLFQLPNAFTPNGDELNDLFRAKATMPNVQAIQRMTVFNRWGDVIYHETDFSPNDLEKAFDGTSGGKDLPPGLYPYHIEVLFLDQVVSIYKGAIFLTR